MKQSNNEKGEFVYLSPPNGRITDLNDSLKWINEKAEEGYYFSGSIPQGGAGIPIFWKPGKKAGKLDNNMRPSVPCPPPCRKYKETFFAGLIETEESKRRTEDWRKSIYREPSK